VECHAVSGQSNEMFSDFKQYVAAIPQIVPSFANVDFDGPGADEDFGLEQATGNPADRYAFRTSPLRNVALQPAFMHNGAFVDLEEAIRYHLDAMSGAATFTTTHLPADLQAVGPMEPVLARLDPLLRTTVQLTPQEFAAIVDFVRNGLLDPAARPERLRHLIPQRLPSGMTPTSFQ
jgi:cytochrome c peroxidase